MKIPTLRTELAPISAQLPALLRLRNRTLLSVAAPAALVERGYADERGLTRKGERVLGLLLELADVHDLPLA